MTGTTQRESAKIYQFPNGGRAGLSADRAAARIAVEAPQPRADIVYGGGWYHDEAVREADKIGQR